MHRILLCLYLVFGILLPVSAWQIRVTVHNETAADFESYVVFTESSRKDGKIAFRRDIHTLAIPRGNTAEIKIEKNKVSHIVFLDSKGYQYVKESVRVDKPASISFSNSDFLPRTALELGTKPVGVRANSKEVTYVPK